MTDPLIAAGTDEPDYRYPGAMRWTPPSPTADRTLYPCPECGHDGPHPIVEALVQGYVFECVGCYAEVRVEEP